MPKRWTLEEVEALQEKWGVVSLDGIARYLGRTKNAIRMKADELKLGDSRLCGDKLSLNQFSIATGISVYTIKVRWVKSGFKFTTIKQSRHVTRKIDMDFFWKWAKDNKGLVNFAKWEEGILGKEPDWVKEKRRADMMDPSRVSWNRTWTNEDDQLLIQKVKTYRYTYHDLAVEFNRTECAIKRRLHDLAVPYRPVPRSNHVKWTDEETKTMIDLSEKGYSTATIARMLDKTQLSISDRLKRHGAVI